MMSYSIIIGLILQAFCLLIFLLRFRSGILQHAGALFLLMLVIYHGFIPEVLNTLFSGRNLYRDLASEESIGNIVLLFSAGIFLFSFCYFLGWRGTGDATLFTPKAITRTKNILSINLFFLVVITVLCYVTTYYFKLSAGFSELDISGEYWAYGLAVYLLPQMLLLTTVALVVSGKYLSLETLLFFQVLINITAVSRSAVLFTLIITLIIIRSFGYVFDRRKIYIILSAAIGIIILISISRGVFGREELTEMSPGERLQSITSSVRQGEGNVSDYLLDDFVYRFDGNASNALILDSLNDGYEPIGIAPVMIDLFLLVPRALNPVKLESDALLLQSEAFTFAYYGHDPTIDYAQGWLGYFLACFGITGFLISLAVLGLFFAALDRWFERSSSSWTIPVYFIVVFNIIYYEGVLLFLLTSIRTYLFIITCLIAIYYVHRVFIGRGSYQQEISG